MAHLLVKALFGSMYRFCGAPSGAIGVENIGTIIFCDKSSYHRQVRKNNWRPLEWCAPHPQDQIGNVNCPDPIEIQVFMQEEMFADWHKKGEGIIVGEDLSKILLDINAMNKIREYWRRHEA